MEIVPRIENMSSSYMIAARSWACSHRSWLRLQGLIRLQTGLATLLYEVVLLSGHVRIPVAKDNLYMRGRNMYSTRSEEIGNKCLQDWTGFHGVERLNTGTGASSAKPPWLHTL